MAQSAAPRSAVMAMPVMNFLFDVFMAVTF
jgi:hypothetical protein